MAPSPFQIDFRNLPLSKHARNQLGAIAESLMDHPRQRSLLFNELILPNHYDPNRGLYIPLSSSQKLFKHITKFRAVPPEILPAEGCALTFFGNPLLLPKGWGAVGFRLENAEAPKLRATNAGFLAVTHEYDCETVEQFEELLSWCRPNGSLLKLDSALQQFRDYRGYCIVFTGGRSLHLHFIFDTAHLEKAPFNADWERRIADQRVISAVMYNVYATYWETVGEAIVTILNPSLPSDPAMKSIGQLRRLPWGTRILDNPSTILGLPADMPVPQLVIKENIRQRAPRSSANWLVPPDFSMANPIGLREGKRSGATAISGHGSLDEVQLICREAWGEYPKPASIELLNGEWTIRFYNHENDKTPSTIVAGDNRKLLIRGKNSFIQDVYLPDHLTAQELGDHLDNRFGIPANLSSRIDVKLSRREPPYKRPTGPRPTFIRQMEEGIRSNFPEPIMDISLEELRSRYRKKLRGVISDARDWSDYVIHSGEGIGKTTAHFGVMGDDAFFTALTYDDEIQRFGCFAFRSNVQACQKAEEYRNDPSAKHRNAVHIQSFWQIYEDCCRDVKVAPIPKSKFTDHSINAVLRKIHHEQPQVFSRLEACRKAIWSRYDAGSTMIFTNHGTATSWHVSRTTRIWHHPDFRPFDENQDHEMLRRQFVLAEVIIDEPEMDEMLHFISKPFFDHLCNQQLELPNWRNQDRHTREMHFKLVKNQIPESDRDIEFEAYDEMMRLDLTNLTELKVDYDKIPFGHDNIKTGIYRAEHGKTFYVVERDWPFAPQTRWGFLTTERLIVDVISKIYQKRRNTLFRVDVENLNGLYPLKIPIYYDTRARSQKVTELAKEIVENNAQACVISDGVDPSVQGVLTFQRMKGSNDLADNDIYVIVTPLAPQQYARLNVIGQWLDIPDIVPLHYQGLINQAVGRNSGFRQKDNTKTVVVTSLRMRKVVPEAVNTLRPRILLYRVVDKPW